MELLLAADRPLGAYELLVAHGLAQQLRSLCRFVACAQAPAPNAPQFLVCDGCGRADERPLADFDALEVAAAAQGFQASSWTLEVHGLCPACAGARG